MIDYEWLDSLFNRGKKKDKPSVKESFDALMDEFEERGIERVDISDCTVNNKEITFSTEGNRNSIAIYRIWGGNVVNVWFGKSNSDSGGRAMQFTVRPGEFINKRILELHKRFMFSGRRKVLRKRR